jgi:hypothetical protein
MIVTGSLFIRIVIHFDKNPQADHRSPTVERRRYHERRSKSSLPSLSLRSVRMTNNQLLSMKAALALALLGLSLAAAQTRWQPQLADRYNYQLGELFVVPTHFIPGVKVRKHRWRRRPHMRPSDCPRQTCWPTMLAPVH